MKMFLLLLSAAFLAGCAGTLEIAGKPVLGIKPPTDKDGSPAPLAKFQHFGNVYHMPPAAGEQPAVASTLSATPQAKAIIAPYETYKSKWGDPRLIVFCNYNQQSESVRVLMAGLEIKLAANRCSDTDRAFEFGQHLVRVIVERGGAPNAFEIERPPFPITIRKDGQAQVIHLY